MTEQEYKDKLAVREQLSQSDRLRLLEYEFGKLMERLLENGTVEPGTVSGWDSLKK
jgi:hypothetical protein